MRCGRGWLRSGGRDRKRIRRGRRMRGTADPPLPVDPSLSLSCFLYSVPEREKK